MSLEQLTGQQLDQYERVWTSVLVSSGAALIAALFGLYYFPAGGTGMLVCGFVVAVSVVAGAIAAAKLHELERGLNGSDRGARSDLDAALGSLDD